MSLSNREPLHYPEHFIYDKDRGIIFCDIPKVACTNWKCIFRYLAGHSDYLDPSIAHDYTLNGLRYLPKDENAWSLINDSAIKKITFVRNPFSRTLSAYLQKFDEDHRLKSDNFSSAISALNDFRRKSLGEKQYPEITFEVFLLWLIHNPIEFFARNTHWKPQSDITQIQDISYDFVGRFENFRQDTNTILKLLRCDISFPTHEEISFPAISASKKLNEYYTPVTSQLVREIFHADFKNFGYSDQLSLSE